VSAPEAVSVTVWGELRAEKRIPGALRVLVGGQHAGAIAHGDGAWTAQAHGLRQSQPTRHDTTAEALAVVLRSPWARRLGARAASRVHWSDRATRLVARASRAAPVAWAESGSRGTWLAAPHGARLAVTRLGRDRWRAEVVCQPDSPGECSEMSPVCRTRLTGQAWAERVAQARGQS
jgi:hypothetical protein